MEAKKIDRRRTYIMMLDTETCNTRNDENGNLDMRDVLVYDKGWQVIDKHGNVYEKKSYIAKEIFFGMSDVMTSAYYANKIPKYLEEIAKGERVVASFYEIRKDFLDTMKRYNTNIVCAHNARFDYNALNTTQRYLTKSKYRYYFPYGTKVWDTLKMARSVVANTPTYKRFCEENDYMTKNNQVRLTAEILYRYITRDNEFVESHTGLEDVDIERQILAYCFRKHKAMKKALWND